MCPHNDIQLFHETHGNLQAVIHWLTLTEKLYSNKNRNLSCYMIMLNVSCNITCCTCVNWGLMLKMISCTGYTQESSFNLNVCHHHFICIICDNDTICQDTTLYHRKSKISTCFSCTKQPLSGCMFHKCKKKFYSCRYTSQSKILSLKSCPYMKNS